MTVEETPLPKVRTGQVHRPGDETLSLTKAKVREVTGASDDVIEEAIKACSCKDGKFKVEDVVTTIIGDDTISSTPGLKIREPQAVDDVDARSGSPSTGSSASSVAVGNKGSQAGPRKAMPETGGWKHGQQNNDYIDLTRDSQGILGGQISREEQDISRVLEASLAESKGSTKRKRGELWFVDPLNPHERKRSEEWPVGLRNVGNTCWFSAVIQSLFHIHKFRNIVLNYKGRPLAENESNHKLRFVCELRQLFGLMVGSHRKYVDPSMAVNILKEASAATALDGQQDVSEFQHKLLDWLEDAFSVPAGSSSAVAPPNPVHQLFQGKYKAEGFNQGKAFSQEVTFGQYPLNVLGFRDIHESLEATTAQGEIETVSGDTSHTSGQEIWFTNLPVVLTFELSRFGFNQQLNRAEKIHQQLSFPPVIYVDRYLECNKSVTRQKREEARKLKEELAALQAKLDRFMNYGSNSKRYPLPDVLQYALEFAESSPGSRRAAWVPDDSTGSGVCADVEMRSPGLNARNSQDVSMTSVGDESAVTESPANPSSPAVATALSATPSKAGSCSPSSHPRMPLFPPVRKEDNSGCSASSSSATPAPEVKKFKDSSVQVEFEPRLMPITVATSTPLTTTAQALASLSSSSSPSPVLSLSSSPSTSNPPPKSPSSHLPCSTSTTVSLTPVETLPLTLNVSSTLAPHPRSCSSEELLVLQACLKRWREEVETDVRELQRNISSLEGKLSGMYSEDCMKKYPYHLHAVLVHEGQAVSGHYWSFIHDWHHHHHHHSLSRDNTSGGGSTVTAATPGGEGDAAAGSEGRWLKFNDITVSESSLAEVQREGVGGFHNASAYCLMYIDRSRLEAGQGDANSSAASSPILLPEDLQRAVEEDNMLFQQEMQQWDEEQRRKMMSTSVAPPHSSPAHGGGSTSSSGSSGAAGSGVSSAGSGGQKSTSTSTQAKAGSGSRLSSEIKGQGQGRSLSGDPDVIMTGEQRPGETSIMRPVNQYLAPLAEVHARLSLQATLTAVTDMCGNGSPSGNLHPKDIFKGAMEREMLRLKNLSCTVNSRLLSEDLRLGHIVLYLLTSAADSNTVKVILAEQFALCGLLDSASTVKGLRHEAQDIYKTLYSQGGREGIKSYEFWHRRYHHYRQAVYMFTEGVTAYGLNKYQEALPYFNQACLHNSEPGLTSSLQRSDGLNAAWLANYRRCSLQRVNEQALQSFERDEDLSESLTVMTRMILPTLAMVGGSDLAEDQAVVERIRGVWCQFLEKDLTEEKVDKLQDFLSKMFEGGSACAEDIQPVRSAHLDSVSEKYKTMMRRLKETGDLAVLVSLSS